MYQHKLAYRHNNEEVEGFVGIGFTREQAKSDCINQIQLKLKVIEEIDFKKVLFNDQQLIKSFAGLTQREKEQIQSDWKTKLRY